MKRRGLITLLMGVFYAAVGQDIAEQRAIRDSMQRKQLYADTVPKQISLTDIVVKGKKPSVTFKLDRQVFRASEYANASNGNVVDLIKNLPAVAVNGQGEISVRGSASIQVLINGRPVQGEPGFVLGQLSAASVESVEYISSPGATFDAEGKNGILNIITKNAPEKGLLVQANVMGGAPPFNDFDNKRYTSPQRHSTDLSLGYQKGKWDISSGLSYIRNDMAGYREGDVYTISSLLETRFPSVGERSFKRYSFGGRFAASLQQTEKSRYEIALYRGKKYQSRVADLDYANARIDLFFGTTISRFNYFNENTAEKEGVFSLATIGSQHRINKEFDFSQSLQYEGADLESLTSNLNFSDRSKSLLFQETSNPSSNPLHAFRWKADLNRKKGNMNWQAGVQLRHDIQQGDFLYLYRERAGAVYITDPFFSSDLDVRNNIQAGYFQFSNQKNKWFWQAGLRVEQMNRRLVIQNNVPQTLNLLNLFPSYLVRYKLNDDAVIKNSFTRRIKRTNNFELNPLPEREHSETLEQGDPNLLPELTGIWELGLEQKWGSGNLAISLYHQRIKNPIQRVNKVFNDTILNRVFTNAGQATQTGIELGFNKRVGRVWQIMIGGNAFRYAIKGDIFNGTLPVNNSSWVFSINTTQTFNFKSNWTLQYSMNYLSLRATAQGEDGAFLTPNLSFKKATKDNRWNFQLQWLFMDAGLGISNIQRITTRGNNFFTTTNYIYEPDQIQISCGFNLTRKNRKLSLPQSEMAEKEF